jgi:hypothetical protein
MTVTATAPGTVVAGAVAVICVGESTLMAVAVVVPNLTEAPDTKPVPVIVTTVPPEVGPDCGATAETAGTGAVYAKSFTVPTVLLDPPDVVTTTSTVDTVMVAGDTAVIRVGEFTVTDAAATSPNVTDAPFRNPVPVIVTDVPPAVLPVAGFSDDTTGTGAVYAKSSIVPVAVVDPPVVVTTTSTVETVVVAGETAVIWVGESTVTVAARSPKATVAPVMKPVPVIVTDVPPAVLPVAGLMDSRTGTGAVYVKSSAAAPWTPAGTELPPDVVTTTLTSPGVIVAGLVAVTCVGDTTTTFVAGSIPNFTDAPDTNPVPVMVTGVPPDVGPDVGDTDDTVGTGAV